MMNQLLSLWTLRRLANGTHAREAKGLYFSVSSGVSVSSM